MTSSIVLRFRVQLEPKGSGSHTLTCTHSRQMVRIDEPGLGALYYSVLGMILVYVLVWPLLYQCKYLAFSVRGSTLPWALHDKKHPLMHALHVSSCIACHRTPHIAHHPQDPVGAVRFNLQAPVVNNCDPTKAAPPCSYAFTNVVDLVCTHCTAHLRRRFVPHPAVCHRRRRVLHAALLFSVCG